MIKDVLFILSIPARRGGQMASVGRSKLPGFTPRRVRPETTDGR